MTIAYIGLGNMGGPMCRNIIKGGHDVVVFDLNPAAIQACVEAGAKAGGSLAETIAGADVIMTSLPMPADVEAVALGAGGILEHARDGAIYVDLSTNSPTVVKRIAEQLAERGIRMLDAPVSGGVAGAKAATIAIMVGGDRHAFQSCLPVFESFGKTIVHTGALGTGSVAKLVNNMLAFCNMTAAAEAMMLGAAAGIDHDTLVEVVNNSSGASFAFRTMNHKVKTGDWSPNFAVNLANKDMRLALELAEQLDVPMSIAPQVKAVFHAARSLGWGDNDVTALMRVYETLMRRSVRDGAG